MTVQLMREAIFPVFPMIVAFAVGFSAGLLYRQMKILSFILFILFVAIISGVISISFSINMA